MNKSELFLEYQSLLYSIGYNMLGMVEDTKDLVQETYLNWMGTSSLTIENPKAYLAKIMTNKCIKHLNKLKLSREQYIGQWLPEPLFSNNESNQFQFFELYHSLSVGLMVILEKLTSQERAVFLLKEIFSFDYSEISHILDKTEDNCRQIYSRAKKHLGSDQKRFVVDIQMHERVLHSFINACKNGDMEELISLLKEDVQLMADGGGQSFILGGKKFSAALNPIYGMSNVARFLIGVVTKLNEATSNLRNEITLVNGSPSLVSFHNSIPIAVVSFQFQNEKIAAVYIQSNPTKLKTQFLQS
jgi:RNA polymerase sigma-70 factor (ECF subfamily)